MSLGNPQRTAIEGLNVVAAKTIVVEKGKSVRVQVLIDGKRAITVGISTPLSLVGDTTHNFLILRKPSRNYGRIRVTNRRLTKVPYACLLSKERGGHQIVELLSHDKTEVGRSCVRIHFSKTGVRNWYRQTV